MDLRFALMTAHLISPHLKKGHKPVLKDYMLNIDQKAQMDVKSIRAVLEGISRG